MLRRRMARSSDDLRRTTTGRSPGERIVRSSPSRSRIFFSWERRRMKTQKFVLFSVVVVVLLFCCLVDRLLHTFYTLRRQQQRIYHETLKFGNVTAIRQFFDNNNRSTTTGMHDDNNNNNNPLRAVFYNIYIPPLPAGMMDEPNNNDNTNQAAHDIVKEQLEQVAAAAHNDGTIIDTVYYTTIGQPFSDTVPSLCQALGLECEHLGYYTTATEVVTLQALYEYCQDPRHQDHQVTYLHSKGTYHDTPLNTRWRRALTRAALGPCPSVCGLQFYTLFAPLFPGNMWTAPCAVVSSLLAPLDYGERVNTVSKQLLVLRAQGYLDSQLLRDRIDYWGLDRYHNEHWIGSGSALFHTSIWEHVPSHITLQDLLSEDYNNNITNNNSSSLLFRAPQRPGFCVGHQWSAHVDLWNHPRDRQKERFLLPGLLIKHELLYGKLSTTMIDSWIWHWYPDGEFWYHQVMQVHDGSALAAVKALHDNDRVSASFVAAAYPLATPQLAREEFLFSSAPPVRSGKRLVFFLHVAQDGANDEVTAAFALSNLYQVLQNVQSVKILPLITVYIYTFGVSSTTERLMKTCRTLVGNKGFCNHVGHWDDHHVGQTLGGLYQYCQKTTDDSTAVVLYDTFLTADHVADCISDLISNNSTIPCNGCLLSGEQEQQQLLLTSFATTCSYVRQLKDPREKSYETSMLDMAGTLLLAQLRQQLIVEQQEKNGSMWLSPRYWANYWITSHPQWRTCHRRYHHQPKNLQESTAQLKDSERIRAETFLAGRLLRWYALYSDSATTNVLLDDDSSWIWTYYPDGPMWKENIQLYGVQKAVTRVTQPYVPPV